MEDPAEYDGSAVQSESENLERIPCALCKAWIPIVEEGSEQEPPRFGICPYRKPSFCKTERDFFCHWGFTS